MSTKRLTKYIRQKLERAIVNKGMEKEEAALAVAENKLALRAYNATYTASDRKRMAELPGGWLKERNNIQVNVTNGRTYCTLEFLEDQRFKAETSGCSISLDASDPLAKDIVEFSNRSDDLKRKRRELRTQVLGVLNSVATVKRLLEVWPEAEQFTAELDLTDPQLPALPIKQLNEQLGIAA